MVHQILVTFLSPPATMTFQAPGIAASCILSRFYSHVWWEAQGGVRLLYLPQIWTSSFTFSAPKYHGIVVRAKKSMLCKHVLCQGVNAQCRGMLLGIMMVSIYQALSVCQNSLCLLELSCLIFVILPLRAVTMFRPILQKNKLRLGEANELAKGSIHSNGDSISDSDVCDSRVPGRNRSVMWFL